MHVSEHLCAIIDIYMQPRPSSISICEHEFMEMSYAMPMHLSECVSQVANTYVYTTDTDTTYTTCMTRRMVLVKRKRTFLCIYGGYSMNANKYLDATVAKLVHIYNKYHTDEYTHIPRCCCVWMRAVGYCWCISSYCETCEHIGRYDDESALCGLCAATDDAHATGSHPGSCP